VSAYVERWNMALGIIFVLIITFMPEGLVPGTVRLSRLAWQGMRKRPAAPAALKEQRP
jgi:branched-chain amino acid transport system permease protein